MACVRLSLKQAKAVVELFHGQEYSGGNVLIAVTVSTDFPADIHRDDDDVLAFHDDAKSIEILKFADD